jgi:HD superfamily phosphohydrolase YqeK
MKNLSPEQMAENLAKFYSLIDKYISGDRKDNLLEMYKDIEETLATSPASTKVSHHNAFAGGYLDHVIRVTEAALVFEKVWDKFGQNKNYTTEELAFAALNHDLGKLGTNDEPVYIPNQSQWHRENQGLMFNYNPAITHMRIAERSLFVLQKYGIQVSENEFLAIRLHDGLYEEANKQYYITYNKDTELRSNIAYILHQADLMSSKIESN